MFSDGDYLFQFPSYIVKDRDGKVFGYKSGDIHGLPIYPDRESAIRAIGSKRGLVPIEYETSAELVAYLRSLPSHINHIGLDPIAAKRAGIVKVNVFIDTLAAAACTESHSISA